MGKVVICTAVVALVFLAAGAIAGVPQLITYQGFLTKDNGQPANDGDYVIRFSIWEQETPGNSEVALWTSGDRTVEVLNGAFSYYLGENVPIPQDLFNVSTSRWLGIMVFPDITEITPRTRLVSSPYAFHSANADVATTALSGGGWTDDGTVVRLGDETDNVGIGTVSPTEKLAVRGNVVISGKATIGLGHLNTGAYAFVAGENNEASGSHSTVGGGGDNIAGGDYASVPGGHSNEANNSNSLASGYRAKANHSGTFVWADQTEADFASTDNNQFLVRASGGVGIGTNAPQAKLHIGGTPGVDGIMFPDGSMQTSAASGGDITVTTGSAADGTLITPPAGYTVAQCHCMVSSRAFGPMGDSQEAYRHWCYVTEEGGGWRVYAKSQNAHYGSFVSDIANYMVIGVK